MQLKGVFVEVCFNLVKISGDGAFLIYYTFVTRHVNLHIFVCVISD